MAESDDTAGAGAATGRAASRFQRPAGAITSDPRVDGGVAPRGRGVGRNRNGRRAPRDPLSSVLPASPSGAAEAPVAATAATDATLPPPGAVPIDASAASSPAPAANGDGSANVEAAHPPKLLAGPGPSGADPIDASAIAPAQAIEWGSDDDGFGGDASTSARNRIDDEHVASAQPLRVQDVVAAAAGAAPSPASPSVLVPPATVDLRDVPVPSTPAPPTPRSPDPGVLPPAETLATLVEPERPATLFDQAADIAPSHGDVPVDEARVTRSLPVIFRTRPRKRVRRVTRVVRHIDTWSVFKVALVFNVVLYVVALTAGVLLWNVAYTTGTIDNIENFFEQFGWSSFEFRGGEIFHNGWVAGLFAIVGLTGLAVLLATLFNLITDLVGGVRVSVLEEEVVARPQHAETTTVRKRAPRSDRADRALAPLARLEREIAAAGGVASAIPRRARTVRHPGPAGPRVPMPQMPVSAEPAEPASVPGPPQPV